MFQTMSLAQYLEILAQATPEDGPYKHDERPADEILTLNTAFAALAQGFRTFVTEAKPIIGYEEVRSMLEEVVHTFPVSEEPEPVDPFAAIKAALLKAMNENPEAFVTEADGPEGAHKE